MFGIGWDLLQPKGNIIAPIVCIPAKNHTENQGSIRGYMEKFFNNGSMTTKFHILNVHEWLGGHAKDWRCVLSEKSAEID